MKVKASILNVWKEELKNDRICTVGSTAHLFIKKENNKLILLTEITTLRRMAIIVSKGL